MEMRIFGKYVKAEILLILTALAFLAGMGYAIIEDVNQHYKDQKPKVSPVMQIKRHTDTGHGSGFHIGEGRIVTAWHVIKGPDGLPVDTSTIDVLGNVHPASVLWILPAYDLAILQVENTDFSNWQVAEVACENMKLGQEGVAIGYPSFLGLQHVPVTVSSAEVRSYKETWKAYQTIVGSLTEGSSGSAVFEKGTNRVGGIMVARFQPGGTIINPKADTEFSFMVPASLLCGM